MPIFGFFRARREFARLYREIQSIKIDRNFWRDRALALEKEQKQEQAKFVRTVIVLTDRVLVSKGAAGGTLQKFDETTDKNGFLVDLNEEAQKRQRNEKISEYRKLLLEDSLKQGKTEEEFNEYWAENSREQLAQFDL